MSNLQKAIHKLQLNNKLVILRTCGGDGQKELLAELTAGYRAVNLALPGVRMQVEQNPAAFARALPLPAYLQNLQYAPSLLSYLLQSDLPLGKMIACCTQSYYLQEAAEQFAAKAEFIDLPLAGSLREAFVPTETYLAKLVEERQDKDILPLLAAGGLGARAAEYVDHVLRYEIMDRTTVKDDIKFFRFLCAVASMTGSVVNYAVLAHNVGVSAPTAKQWLMFLEGAGVVYFIRPIDAEIAGKRLVKAPKLYFRDTGVAAYLLQITDAAALAASVYFKSLYENYVVNVLRESFLQQGRPFQAEFYRDSNNKEISLLLRAGALIYPVIISGADIKAARLQRLLRLLAPYVDKEKLTLGNAVVLTMGGANGVVAPGIWRLDAGCL